MGPTGGVREGVTEVLRGCAALMLAPGEVRPARSLPAAALLGVERGFVAVRRTAPPARRSVIVDDTTAGGVLLVPTADEELVGLVPSRVRIVSPDALDRLLAESEGARLIWQALASALRRRDDLIASLSNARHIERVREKLLRLARMYGKVDGRGVRIDLPLTHELLAEMVCSARETVTRAVDELEREGFVKRESGGYRVAVDPQRLV
jgi:CRP/FNR family cyclic AMP-dependent transcriptional regulator